MPLQKRHAEGLKAAVLDAALDAVVISRDDGRVIELNAAAERLFGHAAAEAARLWMTDLIVPPQQAAPPRPVGNILGVLGRRVALDGRRADGSVFPAEIAIHRVRLRGRTLFAAYVRDLSAQRRAEAALEEGRGRLQQVEKLSAMGSLLASVAHELNNPLAILVAQSTVLRDRAPTPDIEARADRILAAAQRAGRVLKGFLSMARHRAPSREPLALGAAFEDALELLGHGLRGVGIEVANRLPADLPPVLADRDLIGQVFANVLLNAQAALADRDGPRLVTAAAEAHEGTVSLTVEDNGPGIARDVAERMFDPYFTTRPAGTALGVGLSQCRSILAAHGGAIDAEAGAEGGARFRITLPRAPEHADLAASGAPPGLSVLVVDDEIEVAESLADLIGLFGHRVEVVTSARSVLDLVRERRFDVAFADLRMPELDGLALRTALERVDPVLAARTVIVTGDTLARGAGGEHPTIGAGTLMLEKPFTALGVKTLLDRMAAP